MNLKNKNILLGVSGGIAVYKSPAICSLLRKQGANVKVIMTKAAQEFVGPITFKTMTDNFVHTDMFPQTPVEVGVEHIELAKWADIFVVAPATANSIAKFANGIGDDILSTTYLAARSPIMIVPSMNTFMLNSPATRENLQKLRDRGAIILGTQKDLLACNDVGDGKMLEPKEIVDEIDFALRKKDLLGMTITVTAGPTIEAIDPVRYITNHSSGKMGYSIAEEASKRGANVNLITGPSNLEAPKHVRLIKIKTTEEMYKAVEENFEDSHVLIKAAAPADYRPLSYSQQKIKKANKEDGLSIELSRNPDILKSFGKKKDKQTLIGFAAESENEIENSMKKLKEKNLDMIIVNNITKTGFKSDDNQVSIIDKDKKVENLPNMDKSELANIILDRVKNIRQGS